MIPRDDVIRIIKDLTNWARAQICDRMLKRRKLKIRGCSSPVQNVPKLSQSNDGSNPPGSA